MKLVPKVLAFSFGLASASGLAAQQLQVLDAQREVSAFAYGYDYDFNDGEEDALTNLAPTGDWVEMAMVDLQDYYGVPVGTATSYQESDILQNRLEVSLEVTATTAGNLFQEDSAGVGSYHVQFAVGQDVRYRIDAWADVTYGYNSASIVLDDDPNAFGSLFGLYVGQFGSDDDSQTGWLVPGTYTLEVDAEVQAFSNNNFRPLPQAGHAEASFRVYHAGDFDLDQDVDRADLAGFLGTYLLGSTAADYDGDGGVTPADKVGFLGAWRRGMSLPRRISNPVPAGL